MKKVIAFGTFDPLHKGHESYLRQAKSLGDYLIVVVSPTDKIILEKKREPVESDKSRLKKVQELKIADKVILGESGNSYNLLEQVKPDIIALGYDQKIPETLKNQLKKYKIITLKPFKSNKYKSSLLKGS